MKGRKPHPPQGRDNPKRLDKMRRSTQKHSPARARHRTAGNDVMVDYKWQTMVLLLLVCPMVARGMGADYVLALSDTLHDQPVKRLDAGSKCTVKTSGLSEGKICEVEGKTHFIKAVPLVHAKHTASTATKNPVKVSYEEFNRQFVQKNIGGRVPSARFFKESAKSGIDKHLIGSEMIEGLQFSQSDQLTDKELGPKGVARLAVAATFIKDLHNNNWGYNKDGLILIDVDSVHRPPKTIEEFINVAQFGLTPYASLPLSLFNVRQMKGIYEEMRQKPLPKFHEEFHLTKKLYTELLDLYIQACQATIDTVKQANPSLKSNQPTREINDALSFTIAHFYLQNHKTNKP